MHLNIDSCYSNSWPTANAHVSNVIGYYSCFKCSKECDRCKNYLKENNIFHSTCTDRYYSIRQHLNCKSKNVIYLATCKKCKVQYVGSTSNEFKVRFRNHKSAMLTNKNIRPNSKNINFLRH